MKTNILFFTKILRKVFFVFLTKLPNFIKHPIMRSLIYLEYDLSEDFTFKIAETQEELEAAFRILHDAYVEMNFMDPSPSGMRVTFYHALPHNTTIIAKYKEEVIGTVSIIRENSLGLPLDNDFDTSVVSKCAKKRAEVSALAINKNYRGKSGAVLFAMVKYIYEYCINYLNVEAIQIATSPKRMDFYLALMSYEKIEDRVIKDQFVNGAEMVALHVNLKNGTKEIASIYKGKNQNKNLHHYLADYKMTNLKFPDRAYFTVTDPVMTPDMLNYFFCESSDKFHNLTTLQKAALLNIYEGNDYKKNLPKLSDEEVKKVIIRNQSRYPVNCMARLYLDNGKNKEEKYEVKDNIIKILDVKKSRLAHIDIDVEEVSALGLMSNNVDKELQKNATYKMDVQFGKFKVSQIEVELVWLNNNNWGFKLVKENTSWNDFILHLQGQVNKLPQQSKNLNYKGNELIKKVD